MSEMKILGLDGSLQNFGMAVVTINQNYEIVSVDDLILSKTKPSGEGKKSSDDVARFRQHSDIIKDTLGKYDIKFAVGEVPSGARDARAAFAFGGVTALLASLPVPLVEVTPTEVKIASVNYKNADKEDIIAWAYNLFPTANWITGTKFNKMNIKTPQGKYLTNANEHLSDSIAAVVAGLKKIKDGS